MTDTPQSTGTPQSTDDVYEQLQAFVGLEVGAPSLSPDEVNVPMIRHWCEAIGDTNPIYLADDAVAPPTMLQAWVMSGYNGPQRDGGGPYEQMNELLFSHGFTSVVATNCDQTYERYLRPGDRLSMRTVIDAISPEKTTALGTGHFITTRQDYFDQAGDLVGSMLFRIIRFRPASKKQVTPPRPTPATTPDTTWWFDALNAGRLLIQRCASCATLRHPPGPMCPNCHSLEYDSIEAAGTGAIHSHVTVHYPQVPGFEYPLPVVLVDLTEGVRMLMNADRADGLSIGEAVRIELREFDPGAWLPIALRPDAETSMGSHE
jgi:uncharacterized protein